jgi:glycosyltransferase involved in cell wall biosynthesis
MVDVSVIICSHNPRPDYFRRVLDALLDQTLSQNRWELLLIDNASEMPLAATWDISWQPNGRHINEEELGLAPARRRGMREASADLLVFVDDDNILDRDYLSKAVRIKHDWPMLGVWGSGSTRGEFEFKPPKHLEEYMAWLALRDTKIPRWSNVYPCKGATPWGAGLCVRSHVAEAYRKFYDRSVIRITGRQGKVLLSGEDVEICIVACKLGLGMGIFPELRLIHLIPKERVREDYLLKIIEGTHISNMLLAYKWDEVLPRSPFSTIGALSILKNLLTNRGFDRRKYFAILRATIRARRIIAESQSLN